MVILCTSSWCFVIVQYFPPHFDALRASSLRFSSQYPLLVDIIQTTSSYCFSQLTIDWFFNPFRYWFVRSLTFTSCWRVRPSSAKNSLLRPFPSFSWLLTRVFALFFLRLCSSLFFTHFPKKHLLFSNKHPYNLSTTNIDIETFSSVSILVSRHTILKTRNKREPLCRTDQSPIGAHLAARKKYGSPHDFPTKCLSHCPPYGFRGASIATCRCGRTLGGYLRTRLSTSSICGIILVDDTKQFTTKSTIEQTNFPTTIQPIINTSFQHYMARSRRSALVRSSTS